MKKAISLSRFRTPFITSGLLLFTFAAKVHALSIGGDSDACPPGKLCNPLGEDSTLTGFITDILDILLTFAIPIIVLFIMYAGFLYVTAQGDESKIKRAHSALTWSIIGGVIVLAAKLIIEVIQNTVNAL